MHKFISACFILLLLILCFMVYSVFAGDCGKKKATDTDKSAYDRLMSVEKWKVNLHLVYDNNRRDGSSTTHTVSDWTGTLDNQEIDLGRWWTNDMDVAVNGVTLYHSTCHTTIVAKGSEKYSFALKVEKEGYTISQGYCNTGFGTRTDHCPNEGVKTSGGSVTYSEPWKVKVPLPEWSTTLSGSATLTHYTPSAPGYVLPEGTTIMVEWEFNPVRQKELKYRETALDVAAMSYPGKAVDPHIFIAQIGGGSAWIPHANFAGEVWVDGVNKVEIRTGPGPAPVDLNGTRQNVTSEYMILREARHLDMDRPNNTSWENDYPDAIQDWIDNAGISFDAGPPPTWNRRMMDEFLVQVSGHPEIGRIYVAFAMETRKNAYRICYTDSIFISEEEYKKIKASSKPFFPYPFTDKDEGWVELVQDPNTKEWKPRQPIP